MHLQGSSERSGSLLTARPNFLIIGAARSGTTALFQYLEQHPQIFVPALKEPHFLAFAPHRPSFRGPFDEHVINQRSVVDLEEYERLFAGAGEALAVGESSVSSLYYPEASIPNIRRYLPHARMLCILRNPVDRAYSAYMYMVATTRETVQDFRTAWDLEPERIRQNYHHIWHYRQMGLYARQLQPFLESFGRQQLKVVLYDDFTADPFRVVRECYEFVGVNPGFVPTRAPRPLRSGQPRHAWLQRFVGRPSTWKQALRRILPGRLTVRLRDALGGNLKQAPLRPELRSHLRDYYRSDILKLQELLQRDLSAWLEDARPLP